MALEDATSVLRALLLRGRFEVGEKLGEVVVAEELGVSRTIARLAMSSLEHEGLLIRQPNRGSRVRQFSIDDIANSIEVRGELEALAVRRIAEKGLGEATRDALAEIVETSQKLLNAGVATEQDRKTWTELNEAFHETLVQASDSWPLQSAIARISHLPLVSPGIIIFERADLVKGQAQLARAHSDHLEILRSLEAGQGGRASALMREHAFLNARNKRRNLVGADAMGAARALPGGALIA